MHRYAGCYLAHNLMLIAFGKYWKRQISLSAYVATLDVLLHYGRTPDGWSRLERMI
jgi:hypothetical protein